MDPWSFLLVGYAVTVAVETPILLVGLTPRHSLRRCLAAGLWLTACTYPVVILVLPPLLYQAEGDRTVYLIVAETFAPLAECLLFWLAFARDDSRAELGQDMAVIVLANLASFGVGELLHYAGVWTT
jgi:hypothetical protein